MRNISRLKDEEMKPGLCQEKLPVGDVLYRPSHTDSEAQINDRQHGREKETLLFQVTSVLSGFMYFLSE